MVAKRSKAAVVARASSPSNGGVEKPKRDALGLPKQLASSDKKVRDRAIDLLTRWLQRRDSVDEMDLMKIWKGLFYCYWHTDKAPVQNGLAERLASVLTQLRPQLGLRFFEAFLVTMRREWCGIDHHRLDKFYAFVRKFVAGMFRVLKQQEWDRDLVVKYMEVFRDRGLSVDDLLAAQGLSMHLAGIFLEELGPFLPIQGETFELLLEPFYSTLARSSDKVLVKRVKESVFQALLEEARKVEKGDGDESKLGLLVGSLNVGERLFEVAAAASTLQGNRGLLFSLSKEFKKLKKTAPPEEVNIGADSMELDKQRSEAKKKKKSTKKSPKALEGNVNKKLNEDDTVVSNLEAKFEDAAQEAGLPPLEMVLSPLIVGNRKKGKKKQQLKLSGLQLVDTPIRMDEATPPADPSAKKRKRAAMVPVSPVHTASKKQQQRSQEAETPGGSEAALLSTGGASSSSAKRVKKVRFALKRNTVWKPTSPRSSLPLTKPSPELTPKGSALKKGVPPGPVIFTKPKTSKAKQAKKHWRSPMRRT